MVLTKNYLMKLIRAGKAGTAGTCTNTDNGIKYMTVIRYDIQRVDHYVL